MARILICDDEAVLRALVRATLGEEHEIIKAADGDEAIERACSERPDLVILDMMMPARSGIDVQRKLRADPSVAQMPVLMLTARTQASDRAAVERAGADAYLAKPFSPLKLATLVASLINGEAA